MDTWLIVVIVVGSAAVLAMLAGVIVLLVRLVRTFRSLHDADMPGNAKLAFWGSILYTVSPVDLLPDPVYLDDIGLLMAAVHYLGKAARERGLPSSDTGFPGALPQDRTPRT